MDNSICAWCGTPTARPKFCSARCNSAHKYERYKQNGMEAAKRARRNARYVPKPKRPARYCDLPECDRRHLARGLCKKHYYEGSDDGSRPRDAVTPALVRKHGEGEPVVMSVVLRPVASGGAFVFCPNPNCKAITYATAAWSRFCNYCSTTIDLSEEEVSWLILEMRSPEPLLLTGS